MLFRRASASKGYSEFFWNPPLLPLIYVLMKCKREDKLFFWQLRKQQVKLQSEPASDICRIYLCCIHLIQGAEVAQSVKCLATDWTGFDPRQGQRIFPLTSVSRLALVPTQPPVQWVPGGPCPGAKARPGRDADHSPHLVPRSWMSRSYTSSPAKRLHGV
jgi:hypothetical protein